MTERLCKVCREWHHTSAWPAGCLPAAAAARSHLACPMLKSDNIKPVQSQVDGKTYDSRSSLYQHYKQSGVRVVDQGERTTPPPIPKTTRAEVKAAARQVGLI